VDDSADSLRATLTTAGVPADAQPAIVAGLRACLTDRVSETNPDVTPASCRDTGSGGDPALASYASEQVRAGFEDTTVRTSGLSLVLLLAAFGLTFLLPRQARPEAEGH